MKKVLTALGNETLNNELKKYSKYDVVSEDLFYQEAVLDFLKIEDVDVIILSGLLQGQYDMIEFVKTVKKKNITSRIILIVDTISEEEKNILISKGIFDILYDSEIEISDVIEVVDREEPINIKKQLEKEAALMKAVSVREEREEFETNSNPVLITKIQKQEVITVSGIAGCGKSTFIVNLVKNMAKKTNAKILLIDLNTLNGNLDILLNVNKIPENVEILIDEDKKCGINYVADLVSKNRFDTNVLDELVISCGEFDFLSGNTSLHYCQNVLNINCYKKLIEAAKEKYDFIFIDTSSNLFLDSTKWSLQESNRVLFVTEDTEICLKKSVQFLEVIFQMWGIWKNKVQLVLNKTNLNGITEDVYSEVCELKVVGNIKQNGQEDIESYQKILEILDYVPKKSLLEKIGINGDKITNLIKFKKPKKILEEKHCVQ